MMEYPASRSAAREQQSTLYFTGKPCSKGHLAPRFTSVGSCKECCRLASMARHKHSTTKRRAYNDRDSFIAAAIKRHGPRYSYERVAYKGAHTRVEIVCTEHGPFWQSPTNHMQGKNCPRCVAEATGKACRLSLEQFVERARSVWGDRWGYEWVTYAGAHTLVHIQCSEHGMFSQTPTNHLTGKLACPKCNHMRSAGEEEVFRFVSRFAEVVQRDRALIKPKEVDIYLPEKQIAIEYCGEFWHSSGSREEESAQKSRHFEKHKACAAAGVRLITIYETEWQERGFALRRLLRNALGAARGKVMARKCTLDKVSFAQARAFYDRYHPQGGDGNGDHYGLFWRGKLVACMRFTFGANDRGRSQREWTLTRYATRVTVTGGASRLFQAFLEDKKPAQVKSFSDNRFFEGRMYEALGFQLEKEGMPDYTVWSPKLGLRPKSHYQRRMLPKRLKDHGVAEAFDPDNDPRTEAEMTYLMGARRLYDCGKKRWVWNIDSGPQA